MAHARQSRPDSGVFFQGKVIEQIKLFSLRSAVTVNGVVWPRVGSRQTPHNAPRPRSTKELSNQLRVQIDWMRGPRTADTASVAMHATRRLSPF